jgi:hypothetical protein
MRAIVLVLAACHGGSAPAPDTAIDIHALVACDQSWIANGFTQCENACVDATTALDAMGPACAGHTTVGAVACSKTFVFLGVTGCCATRSPQVLFASCD